MTAVRHMILVFLLFSLYSVTSRAQVDSSRLMELWAIWNDTTQEPMARMAAMDTISEFIAYDDADTSLILAQQLFEYAEEHSNQEIAWNALYSMGNANQINGNYSEALKYYEQGLSSAQEQKANWHIVKFIIGISEIKMFNRQYSEALEVLQQADKINKSAGDKSSMAATYMKMGRVYSGLGNKAGALYYYRKSEQIQPVFKKHRRQASRNQQIGNLYQEQGEHTKAVEYGKKALDGFSAENCNHCMASQLNFVAISYYQLKNYDAAFDYWTRCMDMSREIGFKLGQSLAYGGLADIYQLRGEYETTLDYNIKSQALEEEMDSDWGIAFTSIYIGIAYLKLKKYQLARNWCQKGLEYYEESGEFIYQKTACECLYDTYKALQRPVQALRFMEKLQVINDSLKAADFGDELRKYEFQKKILADSLREAEDDLRIEMAHQAEVRKKDRTRNISIGSGLLFLLLAGGFFSRWRYVRKSKAIIEKEKDRSENLLLNILPAEIAEELKTKGKAEARDYDLVSILFTDFKEFTQKSEKLSARELVGEINACFEAFDRICEKHNIEKIKTIGDAYMAAGGLPVPTEDSVQRTVLAAVEMSDFMHQRKKTRLSEGKMSFEMRVGIHTGPVVAGIVGVKKFQYDIWGDTVNTASRLESAGEIGKVNISQSTYELVKDDPHFTFESRGMIQTKGKGEVAMYFVTINP